MLYKGHKHTNYKYHSMFFIYNNQININTYVYLYFFLYLVEISFF